MTMPWSHISRKQMVLLAGGRLSPRDQQKATDHVRHCATCSQRIDRVRTAHAVLADLTQGSDERWQSLLDENDTSTSLSARPFFARNVRFGALTAGACALAAIGFVALLLPARRVEARTTELLKQAEQSDGDQQSIRSLRVMLGTVACRTDRSVVSASQSSDFTACQQASDHLAQAHWKSESLLSSKAFQQWRGQRSSHRDQLKRQAGRWVVTTATDDGAIQEASLELQENNLRAVRLTLHFRDLSAALVVTEEDPKPETNQVQQRTVATLDTRSMADFGRQGSLADHVEVKAWQMLRTADADSAWSSAVVRNGENVDIKIFAEDAEIRRRILKSFQSNSKQSPSRITEQQTYLVRRMSGAGPALAEDWLEHQMPDASQQNQFKQHISYTSREIMGKAIWLDALSARRDALRACDCSRDLEALIETERLELLRMEATLTADLSPYMQAAASPRLLHGPEAMQLDFALQQLFLSSDLSRSSATVQTASVRHLLNIH